MESTPRVIGRRSAERASSAAFEGVPDEASGASTLTLSLVGPGRLGSALARGLHYSGLAVKVVMGRTAESVRAMRLANELGADHTVSWKRVLSADVVAFCVPDSALDVCVEQAACELAAEASEADAGERRTWATRPRAAFHTSGSRGVEALEPLMSLGVRAFALHPAVSVPDPDTSPEVFSGKYAAVENAEGAEGFASEVARRLGLQIFSVAGDQRAAYHLACVMASNLLVALQAAAAEVAAQAGVPNPIDVLSPLARGTLDNVAKMGPRQALTGPIARGDVDTLGRHISVLRNRHPGLLALYRSCSEIAAELAEIDGERKARIMEELGRCA